MTQNVVRGGCLPVEEVNDKTQKKKERILSVERKNMSADGS